MTPAGPTQDAPPRAGPIVSLPANRPASIAAVPALTPRAQLARVVVASALAVLVGAGPAIAWDTSTQLPRPAKSARAARAPSPWTGAGVRIERVLRGVVRTYLPRQGPAPDEPTRAAAVAASSPGAPAASSSAAAMASAAVPGVTIEPLPVAVPEIE